MRVVVTGSGGRWGRSIRHVLAARRHSWVGIDRLPASTAVHCIGDICDPGVLDAALRGADAVIHIAALHAPHVGVLPDAELERTNIDGTRAASMRATSRPQRKNGRGDRQAARFGRMNARIASRVGMAGVGLAIAGGVVALWCAQPADDDDGAKIRAAIGVVNAAMHDAQIPLPERYGNGEKRDVKLEHRLDVPLSPLLRPAFERWDGHVRLQRECIDDVCRLWVDNDNLDNDDKLPTSDWMPVFRDVERGLAPWIADSQLTPDGLYVRVRR